VADSGDIHKLISSAQGGIQSARDMVPHTAKRRDQIAAAQVQADCALALSIDRLAGALLALITTEEKP
jgi:hypothetical protein